MSASILDYLLIVLFIYLFIYFWLCWVFIVVFSLSQVVVSRVTLLCGASVLPKSIQDLFPLRLTGLISLLSKGFSSLLQHHSLKASVLQPSAFFMVQVSHPYMTTGKTIPLTIWAFVSKVMSLLFNTQSIFVIAFLPRSKRLLISWLQSRFTVVFQPEKRKSVTSFTFSHSICQETMRLDAMILVFLSWLFQSPPSPSSLT